MNLTLPAIPAPTVPLMDPQNPNVWNRIWYDYFKALDMVERSTAAAVAVGTVVLMGSLNLSGFDGSYTAQGTSSDHFSATYSVPGVLLDDVFAWSVAPDGFSSQFILQVYTAAVDTITVFVCNTQNTSLTFHSATSFLNYAVIRAD